MESEWRESRNSVREAAIYIP